MNQDDRDRMLLEMHAYARALAASAISGRAKKVIDDYQKALVYCSLNGAKTDEETHRTTNVPRRTITDWVKLFVKNDLAIAEGKLERALFSLEELDIDLAALKKEWEKREVNSR
jgi:predicted HTH transcriptional regulator